MNELFIFFLYMLLLKNALLQETSEEWEQCEKKMKDVRSCMDKFHQALESPQNKKRPLRDQLGLREKMVTEISMQKSKLAISVEKLQVHCNHFIEHPCMLSDSQEHSLIFFICNPWAYKWGTQKD